MDATTLEALKAPRTCPACEGKGFKTWKYSGDTSPCRSCNRTGTQPGLDVQALVDAIFTKRGKVKTFRKSFSSMGGWGTTLEARAHARAYYVWRLARAHGGKDVSIPANASTLCHGDAFKAELDQIAEAVAKIVFGTDMAAAYRWGALLRGVEAPAGLPPAAYPNGPVCDGEKPGDEALELGASFREACEAEGQTAFNFEPC